MEHNIFLFFLLMLSVSFYHMAIFFFFGYPSHNFLSIICFTRTFNLSYYVLRRFQKKKGEFTKSVTLNDGQTFSEDTKRINIHNLKYVKVFWVDNHINLCFTRSILSQTLSIISAIKKWIHSCTALFKRKLLCSICSQFKINWKNFFFDLKLSERQNKS